MKVAPCEKFISWPEFHEGMVCKSKGILVTTDNMALLPSQVRINLQPQSLRYTGLDILGERFHTLVCFEIIESWCCCLGVILKWLAMEFSYTNFIEIGQVGQFSPQASHYVLKFAEFWWVTFALALDDGRSQSCGGIGGQKLINFHWPVQLLYNLPMQSKSFWSRKPLLSMSMGEKRKQFLKGSEHFLRNLNSFFFF